MKRFSQMTNNTAVPPARASGNRRTPAIVVFVLLAGSAALLLYYALDYLSAGRFDAERINGIVEAVRRQQVGKEDVIFRVEDNSMPESLYSLREPLRAAPNVWARRINGALQVAIITLDRGRIGEYGFFFSEVPVTSHEKIQTSTYYSVPGPMRELDRRIDDHWWTAANRDR